MSLIKILITFISVLSTVYASTGEVQLFTYLDGLPMAKMEMVLNGNEEVRTDSEGVFTKKLTIGKHFIEVKVEDKIQSIPFTVAPDEITQITLNLFSNQKIEVDLNDPNYQEKQDLSHLPRSQFNLRVNEKGKGALSDAKIYISGQSKVFKTDKNGRFETDLPIGNYTVSVVHGKFTSEIFKISVLENKAITRNIDMTPAGLELDEFVVVAPLVGGSLQALIEVRKNSDRVADVIGAEQMSKSGDSDAGSSLKRVTGITLVDGKYVYVRGLGERYSSILMNQSTLPSPEPTRKVVPLDIFPSGILESMVIQKSYSPDLPGEFGGGTVILNTKNIPDVYEAKVSLSSSYQSGPSQHMTYAGGERDWLGMDDGTRAMPLSLSEATAGNNTITPASTLNPNGYSEAQIRQFGTELNKEYDTENTRPGPPPSMNVSVGDRFFYRGNKFGYFTSLMYSNKWVSETSEKIGYENGLGGLVPRRRDRIEESVQTIKLGGMLNLGVDLGDAFNLKLNTILLRKTTDRTMNNFRDEEDVNIRTTTFDWTERQLFSQIIRGDHEFGDKDLGLDWLYSFSQAELDRPDERDYRYIYNPDFQTYVYDNNRGNNNRLWTDLTDRNHHAQLAFKTPIYRSDAFKLKFKTGFAYTYKDRETETDRVSFSVDPNTSVYDEANQRPLRPEEIFTQDKIDNGQMVLVNNSLASDQYTAEQRIRALFVDSEISLGEWLTYNMGMRYERSQQLVNTFNLVTTNPEDAYLEMIDYLPVYSITARLPHDMQFRLGYSETVSRPDFRELSNSPYYDNERRELVRGNSELQGTVITNYDARYEWYFGRKENISLGFFRKEFDNPIESTIVSDQYTFDNIPFAENTGIEFEFRKNFGFIGLSDFGISGNATFIHSEVNVGPQADDGLTTKNRPMQGQSPYVLNANLEYDSEKFGTEATVLYNIFGKRISDVGTNTLPDIYERPFHQLDMVFSQKLGSKTKFKFKAQNIINPEARLMQGDQISEVFRKGRAFSAGLTMKL